MLSLAARAALIEGAPVVSNEIRVFDPSPFLIANDPSGVAGTVKAMLLVAVADWPIWTELVTTLLTLYSSEDAW